jgi:endonuclease/exonuclease/phosphatase (EEP) superfamily protein YafD
MRRLKAAAVVGLWVLTGLLGVLTLSTFAGVRAGYLLNIAQTLVPLALLGAVTIAVTALVLRRWPLSGVALAVVAGLVVLVLPAARPACPGRPGPQSPRSESTLRVFSANLRYGNPDGRPIAREALASGADVVVLQEVTPAHVESLRAEGVLDAYPYAVVDARSGAFGSAILSRLLLTDARVDDLAGLPMSRATVTVDGRQVRLLDVHTLSPMGGDNFERRDSQLDALVGLAAGASGEAGTVMVGDFNANRWHPAFRRLLDTGLRDAHEQVGRGLARSWPNGTKVPTFALLDHVLVSPSIAAVSVREGTGRGSDHRPVIADLHLS